jgi:uncharacterized surface protein with fasciclin (FAS1) repeats
MKSTLGSKTIGVTLILTGLFGLAGTRAADYQANNPNGPASRDVVETLTSAGRFTFMLRAINAAGLTQTLRGNGPFTVFAPDDAAFEQLPKATLDSLFKNPTELKQLVLHRVAAQRVSFKGMKPGDPTSLTLRMLDGSQVGFLCDGVHTRHWFGADKAAEIVRSDIAASNGLIQEIDAVALPGSRPVGGSSVAAAAGGAGSGRDGGRAAAAGGAGSGRDYDTAAAAGGAGSGRDVASIPASQPGSLIDALNRAGSFRILLGLLNKAGLTTLLQDPKRSFTVFAPDDKAFSQLDKQTLTHLMSDPIAARGWILPYVLSEKLTTKELASPQLLGRPLETLAGKSSVVRRQNGYLVYERGYDPNTIRPAPAGGSSAWPCCGRIVSADHMASNGVFHAIAWSD